MTNILALLLGASILALAGADLAWNDGESLMFLARKGHTLLNQVAFWR